MSEDATVIKGQKKGVALSMAFVIFNYLEIDVFLCCKLAAAFFTLCTSIYLLQRDFRSRTIVLHKEANVLRFLAFGAAIVAIVTTVKDAYDDGKREAGTKKIEINTNTIKDTTNYTAARVRFLEGQNQRLRAALDKNSIAQSKLIIGTQRKSATDLKIAARSLSKLIAGSDSVPVFEFDARSKDSIGGIMRNTTSEPVYNFTFQVVNYDAFMRCKTKKMDNQLYVDGSCFKECSTRFFIVDFISPNNLVLVNLPKFKLFSRVRYVIDVTLNGKNYEQQAIGGQDYITRKTFSAVRVLEIKDGKVIHAVVKNNRFNVQVDWDLEFPIKDLMRYRTFNFE